MLHSHTPELTVLDPRSLALRAVRYHRQAEAEVPQARVTEQRYDLLSRGVGLRDPRLFALAQIEANVPLNSSRVLSLGGAVVYENNVDSGWKAALYGEASQLLERWDSRCTHSVSSYDACMRPESVAEHALGTPLTVSERFEYASPAAGAAARNQVGRLIRHDDTAGSMTLHDYSLRGEVIGQERRFLLALEPVDWPVPAAQRDQLLEAAPGAMSANRCNPLGQSIGHTDAAGNAQRVAMNVDGTLKAVHLRLAAGAEQTLVNAVGYNAFAQVERETAGNGVVITHHYEPATGRLAQLKVVRADGSVVQAVSYEHDPGGNVVAQRDHALAARRPRHQKVDPLCTYRHDTLYQLIEAQGQEIPAPSSGPQLPQFQSPVDANALSDYLRTYAYDAAGNLTKMVHVGTLNHTREMLTARYSNRSLPADLNRYAEEDIDAAFDGAGNLLLLQRGQPLAWNLRNQLAGVVAVRRAAEADDDERYVYDGAGLRARKVCTRQAAKVTHRAQVRYLPGLEIRSDTATGETLQVISAQCGSSGVRLLHWVEGKPDGIANDQLRYGLTDHLGSCTLELDGAGQIISQESYYPFAGTSWWAGRSAVEAKYKVVRYSGKERDASGLYYYGFRYYAPWLCRWISADPAGEQGGSNRYRMVENNPVSLRDPQGLAPIPYSGRDDDIEKQSAQRGTPIVARGRAQASTLTPDNPQYLDQSLELSSLMIGGALAELKKRAASQDLADLVRATMGERSLAHVGELEFRYSMLSLSVKEYQSGAKYNQIVVESNAKALAHVVRNDPYRRIFLADDHLSGHTVSTGFTVTHELSHLALMKPTRDFAYIDTTDFAGNTHDGLTASQYRNFLTRVHSQVNALSSGTANDLLFSGVLKAMEKVPMDEMLGLFDVTSPQDIRPERLSHPVVRANLMRRNADSVAALGLLLSHDLVKKKLQSWGQHRPG